MSEKRTYYQVKITLQDIEPPIWRRLMIPNGITFFKFHKIIQAAFDWQDYHLFLFEFPDYLIKHPDPDIPLHKVEKEPKRVKIDSVFNEHKRFLYEYDFGDSWRHDIVIEGTVTIDDDEINYPICMAGARNRPPEDVGGVGGYEGFLEIINEETHPEYDDMLLWAEKDTGGRKFDPDYFYKNEVNRKLKRIKC
ncbi:plasmid pRiA4b ORF-3 family protein [Alkalihalobacillus sp. 1P02AB]|uniref:plasmid pRiA4b ORF-3 family protein n=1 Tax=Alkalihalobacillus sp. 1P02AB TaxID=3132260 RepID=UPI0039A6084F